MNDDVLDKAYTVSSALFGPDSGIPWWFWIIVVVALFWKIAIPEPKTAQERSEDRDRALIAHIAEGDGGKKGKKKKK
jgi:hypothetical protein